MGKISVKEGFIYLVGMALVIIGFILPMFKGMGGSLNGFDFINLNNLGSTTIGALLIFGGAGVGLVFCFVGSSNADRIKLIALIATIAGGILIFITYNKSAVTRVIGKGFIKHATYGTYLILVGWVAGIVGWLKK